MRRYLTSALGIGVSVAALAWLASRFELAEVAQSLRAADPLLLSSMPLLLAASFALRAQRWRLLVAHQPPIAFWAAFRALMTGYLLNNLLPARAGDVARALELGRTEHISRTKVLATLVTERIVDLAAMLLILSAVLLSYPALPHWLKHAGMALSAVTAGTAAVLTMAHVMGQDFLPRFRTLVSSRLPPRWADRADRMALSALEGIAGVFRPRHAAGVVALTVLIWAAEVATVFLIARASGLELAPGNALFVLLVIAIGSMVPSSPGFVGTYEFFGVAAMRMIGIEGAPALAFVVLLHVITLLGSTSIGSVCFLLRPKSAGETVTPEAS